MVNHWQDSIKQTEGNILKNSKHDISDSKSLNPADSNKILRFLQRKAKLNNIGDLPGHLFRVEAVTGLLDNGVPIERTMLQGGLKPKNTALRYLSNWDASDWLLVGESY